MLIVERVNIKAADKSLADRLPIVYKALKLVHIETGAFEQLTRQFMTEVFNPKTPDAAGVR